MSITYMAIDRDVAVHDREKVQWIKRGILDLRVDSMTEGIEKAINNQFLYIAINADNINFMPELEILRKVTNDPIIIGTSKFNVEEQEKALHIGADFYGQFNDAEKNMKAALNTIKRIDERAKQRKKPPKIISHGGILISPEHHQVYVNDNRIKLTKIEFDLLYFFVNNHGRVLNWRQIYRNVWKIDEFDETAYEIVKSSIRRLRAKINDVDESVIENLWGIGYKLPTYFE